MPFLLTGLGGPGEIGSARSEGKEKPAGLWRNSAAGCGRKRLCVAVSLGGPTARTTSNVSRQWACAKLSPRLRVTVMVSDVPSFASTVKVVAAPVQRVAVVVATTALPRRPDVADTPYTTRGLARIGRNGRPGTPAV